MISEGAAARESRKAEFMHLYARADQAGTAAGEACVPTPMVVQDADLAGKPVPGGKTYYVPSGVCGFAWIKVRPGNCSFAIWAKKQGYGSRDYYGGLQISVRGFGQSMEQKAAYAGAFAAVLQAAGIKAYAQSRMD
jgi:hypothetical protein